MRLRRVGLRSFRLRLASPLRTAHGPIEHRAGWLVCAEGDDGVVGIGEATPLPEFGTETLEVCARTLVSVAEARVADVESGAVPAALFEGAPCARAAVETALADVQARAEGISLATFWRRHAQAAGLEVATSDGADPPPSIRVQALVGGDTPSAVEAAARRSEAAGFNAFKLKVASGGDADWERDVARVASLRETVGPAGRLRLDANEGWSPAVARRALEALAPLNIDFVEQPLARADLDAMAALSRDSPIDLALDESLLGDGFQRVSQRAGLAKVWVMKPAALGGFEAALEAALLAQGGGLRVVWSTLLDGAVSRMAASQWAAATGDPNEVHGLGTGPLLESDFPDPGVLEEGRLMLPEAAGLGIASKDLFEGTAPLFEGPTRWFGDGHG